MVILEIPVWLDVILIILGLAIGVAVGFVVRMLTHEKSVDKATS